MAGFRGPEDDCVPEGHPSCTEVRSQRRRIAILDDNEAVRRTLALICKRVGAEVACCASLAQLEAILPGFDPDILLVDLMMPDVDGIDALCGLGSGLRAAVYVMTGADSRTIQATRDVLEDARIDVAGYLRKPISLNTMRQLIEAPVPTMRLAVAERPGRRDENGILSPAAFERAVREKRIEPFFQPIFRADCVTLKGFEALARIGGEDSTVFAAQHLAQLVSDEGLAAAMTDLVSERSFDFLAGLDIASRPTISINIFGAHAVADGFRERLVRQCAQRGLDHDRVVLELSEAALFELDEGGLRKITQLRLAGFGLSIDDFGTGSSSLGRLASLPFSELKIDKAFCLGLPDSEPSWAVVETCLDLARRLEMQVTAEGVESSAVAKMLAEAGCDALQGHFFGQAMSGERAAEWIGLGCPRMAA